MNTNLWLVGKRPSSEDFSGSEQNYCKMPKQNKAPPIEERCSATTKAQNSYIKNHIHTMC